MVVGHSMGGVPIAFAGEEVADKIDTFRWNPRSKDPAFLAGAKAALVADGDDDVIAVALNMLTPDAPVAIYGEEPALTAVS